MFRVMLALHFLALFHLVFAKNALAPHRKTCIVQPSRTNSTDDAPAILKAFAECGHGGSVVFLNETYHVNTVMNTTGLKDCQVDLRGTLLVRANLTDTNEAQL
jgi:hypothetical protein